VRLSEAFKETLFRFDLKGKELATKSGLTETQVSDFRNGKNLRSDSLDKLIGALPREAREYMLLLVLEDRESGHILLPRVGVDPDLET